MLALALVLEGYKRGEADLVAHSGLRAKGSFIQTLVLTDIATGWTECMQLLFREQALLTEVLSQMRERLPIDVLGSRSTNLQRHHADVVADRGIATESAHLGQQRSINASGGSVR